MITPLPTTLPVRPTTTHSTKIADLPKDGPVNPKSRRHKRFGLADTPLQVATALCIAKEKAKQPGRFYQMSFVCFLQGNHIIGIEPLAPHRSYNPKINVQAIIKQAKAIYPSAFGVVLATWHQHGLERPWATEQAEEITRQYTELKASGLFLIDHLRISGTGTYSFFASTAGPFRYTHDPVQAGMLKCLY
ncbi:hypothetical protein ACFPMF_11230 [Larkinella bovis]|uniref:RadC-like JAB domain-containing protein n=1 Tax=Larkinella bovis TaxID=683041 RepID=A0ABW0IB24_9BACT